MDAAALRDLYDAQLRADAEVADAAEGDVVRLGPLLLATFPSRRRGFITYASLPDPDSVDELIAAAKAHYDAEDRVDHVEWKTRGHDAPADLLQRLAAHGFDAEESETIMAGTVDGVLAADPGVAAGYTLSRADDEQAIREAEALAGRVFGDTEADSHRRADDLVDRMRRHPGSFEMWCVRDERGDVVCSGRVDPVDGTDFAGLWGGACDEAHRGKGLYRALTAARARAAREAGKRYLQSDCTEYSRPILERAGLLPITTSVPATWHRARRQA